MSNQESSMKANMQFWNSVSKTDPDMTKPISGKGFKGTSITPIYVIQKVTAQFGPIGLDWGFDEAAREIRDGGWYSLVRVWYRRSLFRPGEDGIAEIFQWGGTQYTGTRNAGNSFLDEDGPKKSVTDGLMKCLSYLGFAADVHMGLHDDQRYVTQLKNEKAARNGQPKRADQPSAPSQQTTPEQRPNRAARQQQSAQTEAAVEQNEKRYPPHLDGIAYVPVEIGGRQYIKAEGETLAKKDFLKSYGFRWDSNNKFWLCPAN